jgi:hypothetical protein
VTFVDTRTDLLPLPVGAGILGIASIGVTDDIVLAQQLLRHADVRRTRGYVNPRARQAAEGMKRVEAEVVRSQDAD